VIPLATTTVTFRTVTETEPGEGRSTVVLETGVPAHIGAPSGRETFAAGGGASTVDAVCWSDPVDVTGADQVVDESDGQVWEILAVFNRRGLGQDHTRCQLRRTEGVA
jgi:hypothetical protein